MLKVEYAQWGQTLEELRHMSVNAEHQRTRERFLALYEMAQGSYPTTIGQTNLAALSDPDALGS